ncbi:MAG TPA: 8-amino-7-oxononanoate synthase [Gemmatimonadaceae bacterium]
MTTLSTLNRFAIDDVLSAELSALRDRNLERTLRSVGRRNGALVETERGLVVDFSSNDYLGLASDRRLADAALQAARDHGLGAGGSRLISGNNPEHEALEADVARFFDAEGALTFSSGYAANVGIIPALVGRDDVIFADALNHASLIDGCRLSRATVHVYPHAGVRDLDALLALRRGAFRRAMIVTDGVFSMDGDRAPLPNLIDLARRFDAWTYVDDAHAVGMVGDRGRGTAAAADLHGHIDVTIGTFGKSFGASGAFVYGSSTLCRYLLNRARSFVFSTAVPPANAAAARAAIRIADEEPWRRDRARENAKLLRAQLAASSIRVLGESDAHILPVVIGDAERTAAVGRMLAEDGFLVGAVRPPTVPNGTSRLRIAVSAAHTDEHISALTTALVRALAR